MPIEKSVPNACQDIIYKTMCVKEEDRVVLFMINLVYVQFVVILIDWSMVGVLNASHLSAVRVNALLPAP